GGTADISQLLHRLHVKEHRTVQTENELLHQVKLEPPAFVLGFGLYILQVRVCTTLHVLARHALSRKTHCSPPPEQASLAAISHLGTELVECFFKFLTHFGGYIALRSTLRPVHDWQLCVRRDKHLAWLAVNAVKCPHQGAVLKPSYLNPARLLADNVEVVTGF